MKLRFGSILLLIGLALFASQTVSRISRERQFYRLQLHQQADAIESGLREKWRAALLAAARRGELAKDFVVTWDRQGRAIRSRFFPDPGMQLDWLDYRTIPTTNLAKRNAFLKRALEIPHSWDRVLAIDEWKRLNGELPELTAEGYERTLVDAEARGAYAEIFGQFETGKDFTFAPAEIALDRVFYRSVGTSELEGFLPSLASAKKAVLPAFLAEHRLENATFGTTALDIRFPNLAEIAAQGLNPADGALLAASAALLAVGLLVLAAGMREQRNLLFKRVSFLNQVVHELKTPLAGMKLNAQLMLRGGGTPESQARNLRAIDESISRLDRLFDDVVQVNRPESRAETETLSAANVNATIEAIAGDHPEGQVRFEARAASSVRAEGGRLRLILRNLIGNAVKYGEVAHVDASRVDGGRLRISVRDDGPGVAASDRKKIFEEFYRSQEARNTKVDGLGLGLALARKLAREIGADIVLTNPGVRGAEFALLLPLSEDSERNA